MSTTTDRSTFEAAVGEAIERFTDTRLVRRVDRGELRLDHYHALLVSLLGQTRSTPYTFARAAVNCSWRHERAKEYLLQHADEEKAHWRWILNDLEATGYDGPDLRGAPPVPSCQAFVGLNYFVAEEAPVARLAVAMVLEGIGARYGGRYGRQLLEQLALEPRQASFILSHGETDIKHSAELAKVVAESALSPEEWRWMAESARAAGRLYRAIYDDEAFA